MSEMQLMTGSNVEVNMSDIGNNQMPASKPSELSFSPENFASDIEKLRAQMAPAPVKTETAAPAAVAAPQEAPVVTSTPNTPAQPATPAATTEQAAKTPEVPEKFKNPDGTLNTEKLEKSTVNAQEALDKYITLEKELKRKMNQVQAEKNLYLNPQAAKAEAPVSNAPVNPDFAKQIEVDIAREGVGPVLTKLFTAAQEAAYERAKQDVSSLKEKAAESERRAQVDAIGQRDPWVYTQEGLATLSQVLTEQPYLWEASDPYKAAYMFHKGSLAVNSVPSVASVLTPTPTARPSAPVPTGQAASQTAVSTVKLDSKADIDRHLKSLTPAQQSEFFKRMGFPGF